MRPDRNERMQESANKIKKIGLGWAYENPRDGGAWWAAVYGVAQSRTRLKRFSSSSVLWEQDTTEYNRLGLT